MHETEPRLIAETPPVEIAAAAQLHKVARKLTAAGEHKAAAEIRSAIISLRVETIAIDERLSAVTVKLDEVTAEATVLAAHGPDVMVPARETGDRLLRVVGGER